MTIDTLGERLVKVTLTGRLDTPGVDGLETRFLAALVPGANNAIVDLSRVDFLSSMGIRMLLQAARSLKARKAMIALYAAQPRVGQVFDAVALKQLVPICATEAEALAAVGSTGA
jgi:anti-anti-sigma factor